MKYNAPYGSADPNASYKDHRSGAVKGSFVPALAIEMPQREIVTVVTSAGLVPDDDDPTQLDQAIDLKIAAATGGGGDDNYVLMTQARVRLPIYPEVLTSDGRIPCVTPSTGQVQVPAGYEFLHRGIFSVTTAVWNQATAASKTYHLRWRPVGGFVLKDLADPAYNPAALAESNVVFDTGYDDMLVAKVTTNPGNVVTIVNLVNKDRLVAEMSVGGVGVVIPPDNAAYSGSFALNWARSPIASVTGSIAINITASPSGGQVVFNAISVTAKTRYAVAATVSGDINNPATAVSGQINLLAVA